MSIELTATEIAKGLLSLSKLLEKVSDELDVADVHAVETKQAADKAEAMAFLRSSGPVDERRYKAKVEVDELRLAAELAAAQVRRGIRARDTIKVRVDIGRSANAALRAEIGGLS